MDVLLAQIAGVDVSELARDDAFQGQVSSEGQMNIVSLSHLYSTLVVITVDSKLLCA